MSKFSSHPKLDGLVAATYTPLHPDGSIHPGAVPSVVDHLLQTGVKGLYVCGSTGEGISLSSSERKEIAAAYTSAAAGKIPVLIQVGHNSLAEARDLAQHASQIGATAISATCPSYFKIGDAETLIDSMSEIASAAPDLPFYYYHIPALTGSPIDMAQFLPRAAERIPNLVGLKYTDTKLFEFQECLELQGGRFDVVWGCDEMLLGAWATGARAAIGSTYNIAAPLYLEIIDAWNRSDMERARQLQLKSIRLIRILQRFSFHSAMKQVLSWQGLEMGTCRLPQSSLSETQVLELRQFWDNGSIPRLIEPQEGVAPGHD